MGIDLDGDILEEGTRLLTQLAEVVKAMHDHWPKAADLVAAAGDDVLAYMSFPQEHWTRTLLHESVGAGEQRGEAQHQRRRHFPG